MTALERDLAMSLLALWFQRRGVAANGDAVGYRESNFRDVRLNADGKSLSGDEVAKVKK